MAYWHITITSVRRMTMFPTEAALRTAVRCLVRVCGARLVLFCVVDDHVHVVLVCSAKEVGRAAAALLIALRSRSSARLEAAHWVPVESRSHLEWLVRYLLAQVGKHGVAAHDALYGGSCFQDLIGARIVAPFEARIFRALPRLRRESLCTMVGVPTTVLTPATDGTLRYAGAERIVAAAAAACGVGPTLAGRCPIVVAARCTAIQLVDRAGLARTDLTHALPVAARTIRRCAEQRVDPSLLTAARLQISLAQLADALPRAATG